MLESTFQPILVLSSNMEVSGVFFMLFARAILEIREIQEGLKIRGT